MNPGLLVMAAQEAEEESPIIELIGHLMPHKYGWAPDWRIGSLDFSITNAVLNMWLAAAAVILLFWVAASKRSIVPSGLQNAIEVVRDFVKENLVYQVLRPDDARTWGPFIETIFFFILFMNLAGLIPGVGFTPTSNIFVTAALAISVYLLAITVGMAKNGPFTFWKKTLIPEGLPGKNPVVKGLVVGFFLIVETISQLARPFSLAVRLFANMLADHIILLIFVGFIFLASGIVLVLVFPVAIALEIVFTGFALFVAFIQAVIFAYLTAFYLNDALHPGH